MGDDICRVPLQTYMQGSIQFRLPRKQYGIRTMNILEGVEIIFFLFTTVLLQILKMYKY